MASLLNSVGGLNVEGVISPDYLAQLEQLYRATREQPIKNLQARKSTLEKQSQFYSDFLADLSSLASQIAVFKDVSLSLSKFQQKSATISESGIVSVSATSAAATATYALHVTRLATTDFLVSDQKVASDPAGYTAGTKSFDLIVNGETTTITVDFSGTETFEEAMERIADAINTHDSAPVQASVVHDQSLTVRLVFLSAASGQSNNITFADPDNVLANLGLTTALFSDPSNRTLFTDTTAGYQRSNIADLDAEFSLNGITIRRGQNTIDDVIEGVTFTLLKEQEPTDPDVSVAIAIDPDKVKSSVSALFDSYNAVLTALTDNSSIVRGDYALQLFRSDLRVLASSAVGTGAYQYLRDIGITIADDGTLSISDTEEFAAALSSDPEAVAQLFADFATALDTTISSYVGDTGLVQSRKESVSSQIEFLDERITTLEERLEREIANFRDQYVTMLELYIEAQQQLQLVSTFGLNLTALSV